MCFSVIYLNSLSAGAIIVWEFVITIQYIPRNMHTVFALLRFVVVIHWLIFPYPSGLLHWHCGNLTIAPVPAKQPWWIWINTSCEFIMNNCITTTKQSTTKPCAYFLGYTVSALCVCHYCGVRLIVFKVSSIISKIFLLVSIQNGWWVSWAFQVLNLFTKRGKDQGSLDVCSIERTVPLLKPPQSPHCHLGVVDHSKNSPPPPPLATRQDRSYPTNRATQTLLFSKPFDLAQVCHRNKICTKPALTWKLTLVLAFPAHCTSN